MNTDTASQVAISALGFLAADPALAQRFLRLSGLEAHGLRQAAAEPAFFAGLLDFFLADERTLTAFAEESGLAPETIAQARASLAATYGTAEA